MPATTDIVPKWGTLLIFLDAANMLATEVARAKKRLALPKQ
jgi:hypothetical protein